MGFRSVFRSLQEIFPQVDVRILKAIAIEHSNDADAAVEFVLLEVLPTICSHLADCEPDSQEAKHPSAGVESEEPSFLLNSHESPAETHKGADFKPTVCIREDFGGAHQQMDSSYVQLTSLDESTSGAGVHSPSDLDQTSSDSETRVLFPMNHQNTIIMAGSKQSSYAEVVLGTHKDAVVAGENSSSLPCIQDVPYKPDVDPLVASNGGLCENYLDTISPEDETTIQDIIFQPFIAEEKYDLIDHVSTEGKNDSISECIGMSTCSLEPQRTTPANSDDLPGVAEAYHDSQLGTAIQSSQITSINYLEEFITNAKSNKKILLSSMESILDMVGEVEMQEKAAEQAKEEAAKGSLATLAKVEELKRMLEHAKEANAMHSGEVYGERAILATEALELHSRLMNLSDERARSLLIIDQMRHDLEARLAAAEREMALAERERQEQHDSASKAYAEQQLIMERVVEGSKQIQQQAEENAKLREFLMDHGRVVDALQGEIAVICEDVKALKERIDGRLPVSKSLSSSQGSFILASLSTFQKNASRDQALEMTSSSGILKSLNQELSKSQQSNGTVGKGGENEAGSVSGGEENEAGSASGEEDNEAGRASGEEDNEPGSDSRGEGNGESGKFVNGDASSLKEPSDDEWLLFD